jgi:hypothetical protein
VLPNSAPTGKQAALCRKQSAGATKLVPTLALHPREEAKALGISPRLLWQLTKYGRIPCVRISGGKRKTILYPVAELQAWLSRESNAAKGGEQ